MKKDPKITSKSRRFGGALIEHDNITCEWNKYTQCCALDNMFDSMGLIFALK